MEKGKLVNTQILHSFASILEVITLPSYNLHESKGDKKGIWSIKVSGNWRITFKFEKGHAYNLNLEDYH